MPITIRRPRSGEVFDNRNVPFSANASGALVLPGGVRASVSTVGIFSWEVEVWPESRVTGNVPSGTALYRVSPTPDGLNSERHSFLFPATMYPSPLMVLL